MKSPQWIVTLGASAGGVEALRAVFQSLSASLDAAFLVVLHLPPHSPSRLDKVLGAVCSMPVCAPGDGERVRAGHVYVASADLHLMIEDGRIRQSRGPKECRARPSVDVLFRSAAVSHGPAVIGVVLSGMLDDGTAGLWAIKDRGGHALVQDPAYAMHAAMPSSAIEHVDVDATGTCAELARRIGEIASGTPRISEAGPAARLATENRIASEGNALQLGVMDMGKVSQYTCPDCHGVLVQIEEGSIVRFRCHTGHAFSLLALLAEVNTSIDKGLWDTIRAIEERVLLLRQISKAQAATAAEAARTFEELADDAESSIKDLKRLVLDTRLFGRQR
ncbi:chemotaxis protein CheB [Ramlibacter sp.]|uniref:chemotaxis protein CheB n=1 Tax=Ramlibacter sp. TaxID=1917967 RepID=UPI002FC881BC